MCFGYLYSFLYYSHCKEAAVRHQLNRTYFARLLQRDRFAYKVPAHSPLLPSFIGLVVSLVKLAALFTNGGGGSHQRVSLYRAFTFSFPATISTLYIAHLISEVIFYVFDFPRFVAISLTHSYITLRWIASLTSNSSISPPLYPGVEYTHH